MLDQVPEGERTAQRPVRTLEKMPKWNKRTQVETCLIWTFLAKVDNGLLTNCSPEKPACRPAEPRPQAQKAAQGNSD